MRVIERTQYFALPGHADAVLRTRREACRVRIAEGLPGGEILVRAPGGGGTEADVTWQCAFRDEAAQAADLAARAASAAFEAVRAEMRTHYARFERHVFNAVDTELPSRMRPTPIEGYAIHPRRLTFTHAGHKLRGWLHLPPGLGPFPCVITNHGSGINQGTEDTSRPGTAALLMSWGIASFLPHRRGYGDSEGPAWRADVPSPSGTPEYDAELSHRLDSESDDILAALDVVAALPEIDAAHIAVMGSSFGGVTTLLAASKTDRFACAIDFAGAAMNWDRAPALRALMTRAALRLSMPLFLIQAANDYSVRPTRELAEALAGSAVTFQAHVYPAFGVNHHEGHLLESRGPTVWAEDVRHFLERHL